MKKSKTVLILSALLLSQAHSEEPLDYANCKEEDFVLVDAAEVNIETQGISYSPRCLEVKAGTTVTISAANFHPLQASNEDFDGIENPFRGESPHTQSQSRVLVEVGHYGYVCVNHGNPQTGSGMAGLIRVSSE